MNGKSRRRNEQKLVDITMTFNAKVRKVEMNERMKKQILVQGASKKKLLLANMVIMDVKDMMGVYC